MTKKNLIILKKVFFVLLIYDKVLPVNIFNITIYLDLKISSYSIQLFLNYNFKVKKNFKVYLLFIE